MRDVSLDCFLSVLTRKGLLFHLHNLFRYDTKSQGLLCQPYTAGYTTGPQPYAPGAEVRNAVGGVLGTAPATMDIVVNGIRSGTFLGGVGTGGYELRADGTFHLSTTRNQSPAAEPWQGTVRDAVLAVALDGVPHVVRLRPFGNVSGVPQIIYHDRFPVARLDFLDLKLYAYSALSPGDTDGSNTPAVIFTLHATNSNRNSNSNSNRNSSSKRGVDAAAPMNVTFMVVHPLAIRNDWQQVGKGRGVPLSASPPIASASACAAACRAAAGSGSACYAWAWVAATAQCTVDATGYAQGANVAGVDSGNPGTWHFGGTPGTPGAASTATIPSAHFTTTDASSASVPPYNGLGSQGLFVPGVEAPPHLDSEGGGGFTATRGVGAAGSVEALLRVLRQADPATALNSLRPSVGTEGSTDTTGTAGDGGGALFGGAAASAHGIPAGATASLSIVHAWHFPRAFWYRDRLAGSDNGVRYSTTYAGLADVAASLNLTNITSRLLEWQSVYAGLPDPLLRDAAFNYFNHLRSAMWTSPLPTTRNNGSINRGNATRGGGELSPQFRQWESVEFTDFSNPTNGDERHLPYFHTLPDAMRAKLLSEAAFAQDGAGSGSSGMFQCVVNSMSGDRQWGSGDPCKDTGPGPHHPDDISMFMVGVYELFMMANDTALVDALYDTALLPAFRYYVSVYNATAWHVPYMAHETYDAVPESSTITGEGNTGSSLYNAVNYLAGLHCMRDFAAHRADAPTEAASVAMIALVQASIQEHFWQPGKGFYAGDTHADYSILMEEGDPTTAYHSNDGLHGQVLAYRLGFGDMLPRAQMLAHQRYVSTDLATPWGLSFDR